MSPIHHPLNMASSFWIVVRPEPPGQFTAQAVGLPEIRATALVREEAIEQVRSMIRQWLAEERLVVFAVPPAQPWLPGFGQVDPNSPEEQAYLQELARLRQEDLERTLREYEEEDRACSNTSSIPTT